MDPSVILKDMIQRLHQSLHWAEIQSRKSQGMEIDVLGDSGQESDNGTELFGEKTPFRRICSRDHINYGNMRGPNILMIAWEKLLEEHGSFRDKSQRHLRAVGEELHSIESE